MTISSSPDGLTDISPAAAFRRGALTIFGTPIVILGASFIGFGAQCRAIGLGADQALFSTLFVFALPGQIVMIEQLAIGAGMLAIAIAVGLANLRLLPMVVTLQAHIRHAPGWQRYALAHLIAVTSWVHSMREVPQMTHRGRVGYIAGIGLGMISGMAVATLIGFFAAEVLPGSVAMTLIFINPIYFLLVLLTDMRARARLLSIGCGALIGPAAHQISPEWGLLIAGVTAGSIAFIIDEMLTAREARTASADGSADSGEGA